MDWEDSRIAFLQETFPWLSMDKLKAGIFGDSHEEPNVWRSTERSWTVHLAVTEVSSYKLPGKLPECGIRQGNWRATEEFTPTQDTSVSQTALSADTLGLCFQELCRFEWRAEWALSPRHSHYGRVLTRPVGCKLSHWSLLVLETGCGHWRAQEEILERTLSSMGSFFFFCIFLSLLWHNVSFLRIYQPYIKYYFFNITRK